MTTWQALTVVAFVFCLIVFIFAFRQR